MGVAQASTWNHFVPRMILKRFECSAGQLWEYPLLVSHETVKPWKKVSVRKTAARSHLYTFVEDGEHNDELECWFGEFEGAANQSIDRVVAGQHVSKDDWQSLARLFALQDMRTPLAFLEARERFMRRDADAMKGYLLQQKEKFEAAARSGTPLVVRPDPENKLFTMKVVIEQGPHPQTMKLTAKMVFGRKMWLWNIRRMLSESRSLEAVCSHQWTILKPPRGEKWFTTDSPTLKLAVNQSGLSSRGGWGAHGNILMMPLTPDHLLFTQIGVRTPQLNTELTTSRYHLYRELLAKHAFRSIYATCPTEDVRVYRPRLVNEQRFRYEERAWVEWDGDQSVAEAL